MSVAHSSLEISFLFRIFKSIITPLIRSLGAVLPLQRLPAVAVHDQSKAKVFSSPQLASLKINKEHKIRYEEGRVF